MTDGEGSGGDVDEQEVTDECAMLIHADHMHKHLHSKGQERTSGIFIGFMRKPTAAHSYSIYQNYFKFSKFFYFLTFAIHQVEAKFI